MTVQELADRLVTLCNEGKGDWLVELIAMNDGTFEDIDRVDVYSSTVAVSSHY